VNIIAIDCEMVQTDVGLELARVSVIDYDFNTLLNEFVLPDNIIIDYNTKYLDCKILIIRWSGITKETL
jgi:RNA exonuclease 1